MSSYLRVPRIILLRWIDELIKTSALMEVLYRSVTYTHDTYGTEADKPICKGDDELVKIIRDVCGVADRPPVRYAAGIA